VVGMLAQIPRRQVAGDQLRLAVPRGHRDYKAGDLAVVQADQVVVEQDQVLEGNPSAP